MIDFAHPDGVERMHDYMEQLEDAATAFAEACENGTSGAVRTARRALAEAALLYANSLLALDEPYPKDMAK